MNRSDLPALHRAASGSAHRQQRRFFGAVKMQLSCLIIAALVSVININHWSFALAALIVLVVALGCSVYLAWIRPDSLWYASRAVAESVKTLAWRFAVRAEPFNMNDEQATNLFVARLRSVLDQNGGTARLFDSVIGEEITDGMRATRGNSLEARKASYLTNRVAGQQAWYAKRALENRKLAGGFLIALIAFNFAAVLCAGLRLRFAEFGVWPTDLFITAAACLLSWSQAKRFSELSSSYTLAASEIRLIQAQAATVLTEELFSDYVGDTENAFSREHTQWIARKDSPI